MNIKKQLQKIDFGYACISSLIKNCSTAGTVPLGRFQKLPDDQVRLFKLEETARSNLTNTTRLLWHNITEGFKLYRFSSQLIPLANHPAGEIFDFNLVLAGELSKIGSIVRENHLKVSTHPGQYTVINTREEEKFQNAVRDLSYHHRLFEAMGLDDNAVMVTHVGGVYGDKPAAMKRFITNFKRLPQGIQQRLVIENDDSSYSIGDVLELCQSLNRPMVLDAHHHYCYNQGEDLEQFLPHIFNTWQQLDRPPKVHFSSPASQKHPRRHADFINPDVFLDFVKIAAGASFDVMVEAKQYDAAVLQLWDEIGYQTG